MQSRSTILKPPGQKEDRRKRIIDGCISRIKGRRSEIMNWYRLNSCSDSKLYAESIVMEAFESSSNAELLSGEIETEDTPYFDMPGDSNPFQNLMSLEEYFAVMIQIENIFREEQLREIDAIMRHLDTSRDCIPSSQEQLACEELEQNYVICPSCR